MGTEATSPSMTNAATVQEERRLLGLGRRETERKRAAGECIRAAELRLRELGEELRQLRAGRD